MGPLLEVATWLETGFPVLEITLLETQKGRQRTRDEDTTVKNKNYFSPHFHSQSRFSWQAEVFPFGQTMDHSHFGLPHQANNVLSIPYPSGYRPNQVTDNSPSLSQNQGILRNPSHTRHVRVTTRVQSDSQSMSYGSLRIRMPVNLLRSFPSLVSSLYMTLSLAKLVFAIIIAIPDLDRDRGWGKTHSRERDAKQQVVPGSNFEM